MRKSQKCAKRQKSGDSLCFFHWFVAPDAKVAGAEPSDQMRDEKLHAVVARSTFGSQNVQNTSLPFWQG